MGGQERGRRGLISDDAVRSPGRVRLPAARGSAAGTRRGRTQPSAAERRQRTSPGGGRETEGRYRWREHGRAGAPELFRKALLAQRAATRRCRASTRSSHELTPLARLPLISWSLVAGFVPCFRAFQSNSKLLCGHSARRLAEDTQLHGVPGCSRRMWSAS